MERGGGGTFVCYEGSKRGGMNNPFRPTNFILSTFGWIWRREDQREKIDHTVLTNYPYFRSHFDIFPSSVHSC